MKPDEVIRIVILNLQKTSPLKLSYSINAEMRDIYTCDFNHLTKCLSFHASTSVEDIPGIASST